MFEAKLQHSPRFSFHPSESHLEVRLLQDPGQLGNRLVFSLQALQGLQDVLDQLDVVALHGL